MQSNGRKALQKSKPEQSNGRKERTKSKMNRTNLRKEKTQRHETNNKEKSNRIEEKGGKHR